MYRLKPKSISKVDGNKLKIEWEDGFSGTILLEKFRNSCPCAVCKDDREKSKKSTMIMMDTFSAGKNNLVKLELAGNYALNAVWGDGHDTGFYTWDYLWEITEKFRIPENNDNNKSE